MKQQSFPSQPGSDTAQIPPFSDGLGRSLSDFSSLEPGGIYRLRGEDALGGRLMGKEG